MKIDVAHIAKLANLVIHNDELEKFEQQLSQVLDYVQKLDEVDVTHVEATSQTTGLENVCREDIPGVSLSQDEALSNAKNEQNGLFQVKGILHEE